MESGLNVSSVSPVKLCASPLPVKISLRHTLSLHQSCAIRATDPTNLQQVADREIIKKPNKYAIVLFWPHPLKAEIRVRIPASLAKPA